MAGFEYGEPALGERVCEFAFGILDLSLASVQTLYWRGVMFSHWQICSEMRLRKIEELLISV